VSSLITHNPAEPGDDDPTGVRDLLSSLPQPAPMPDYLVERINTSLAAEQAQRAAASTTSVGPVIPLLAPTRRRPGRLVFAVASAAAAVALFTVVGSNLLQAGRSTTMSGTASAPITSGSRAAGGQVLTDAGDKATHQGVAAGSAATPPLVQIRLSGTRYTQAGFITQARNLRSSAIGQTRGPAAEFADAGPVGTTPGLIDCLEAIGAGGAQAVRAEVAFYEGRPAVIIVTTAHGTATAYVVGRQCSHADAAILRPATPLP
jgi:hypothetical protein